MNAPTRPAVRWHGGKWLLAPWIIEHMPEHRVYTEAFGGGGNVLLRKPPAAYEVFNDLDDEIVNLFRVLRDPARARDLRRKCQLTPYARSEFCAAYKKAAGPVECARRMLVRAFMGHGSDAATRGYTTGFRVSTAQHTSPTRNWLDWPSAIPALTARLSEVTIEALPADEILRRYDCPEALHYIDPPYVSSTRKCAGAKHGYRHEMNDKQHAALSRLVHRLKGYALVSGYRSALYDKLYGDWPHVTKQAQDGANKAREEVLWLSPRTWEALHADMFSPTRKARAC